MLERRRVPRRRPRDPATIAHRVAVRPRPRPQHLALTFATVWVGRPWRLLVARAPSAVRLDCQPPLRCHGGRRWITTRPKSPTPGTPRWASGRPYRSAVRVGSNASETDCPSRLARSLRCSLTSALDRDAGAHRLWGVDADDPNAHASAVIDLHGVPVDHVEHRVPTGSLSPSPLTLPLQRSMTRAPQCSMTRIEMSRWLTACGVSGTMMLSRKRRRERAGETSGDVAAMEGKISAETDVVGPQRSPSARSPSSASWPGRNWHRPIGPLGVRNWTPIPVLASTGDPHRSLAPSSRRASIHAAGKVDGRWHPRQSGLPRLQRVLG